jgi:hypothetical protein
VVGGVLGAGQRPGLDVGDDQLGLVQAQVLPVEAELQLAADGEEGDAVRAVGAGRAQGVDEGVVGGDLEGGGVGLGGLEGALDADLAVGQLGPGGVEADQPAGGGVPAVGGRVGEALVELVELVRGEQHAHRADLLPGEHLGIERGADEVVLRGGQGGDDLAVGEVRGAPRGGQRDALGADAELGGRTVRVQVLGVGGAGHPALGGERDDGHAQGLDGLPGRRRGVRVPYTHVDRGAEGDGDQQHQDQGLPGQAPVQGRAAADGGGVLGHPLHGGVLLEAGSTDERLVEDDGSVFVLTTTGGSLGCPLRWLSRRAHTFRVGLGEPR